MSIGLNTLLTQFLVSFRSRLRQQQKEISELRQLQQQLSKGRAITNVDLFNRIADGSSSQRTVPRRLQLASWDGCCDPSDPDDPNDPCDS